MNTMAPEAIITADTAWISAGVRDVLLSFQDSPAVVSAARYLFDLCFNDEPFVSGVCERFYVRGGLDSTWSDPDAAVTFVQAILAGYADDDLRWMTRANRVRVATAAMRGWAEHHSDPMPPPVWHRLIGGTICAFGGAA